MQECQNVEPDTVVEVTKVGYKLRERCIRPALVGVSRKWNWFFVGNIIMQGIELSSFDFENGFNLSYNSLVPQRKVKINS